MNEGYEVLRPIFKNLNRINYKIVKKGMSTGRTRALPICVVTEGAIKLAGLNHPHDTNIVVVTFID